MITHCYVERRLRPLNLYLREVDADAARARSWTTARRYVISPRSNIFPGDLLLKNFGITGHGRAIFYDYDELCLVTECRFRELPKTTMRGADTYYVGPQDVFPEQFPRFLGLNDALRDVLLEAHGDIFSVRWWQAIQDAIGAGRNVDAPPYPDHLRVGAYQPMQEIGA